MNEIEKYLASLFDSEEDWLAFKLQHTFEFTPMWEEEDGSMVLDITGGPELPAHIPYSIAYSPGGFTVEPMKPKGEKHGPYVFEQYFDDGRMEYVREDGTVVPQ